MEREFKGQFLWSRSKAIKTAVCTVLVEAQLTNPSRIKLLFPGSPLSKSLATMLGVRRVEQLERQVLAALVRDRKEPWAKQWRLCYNAAVKAYKFRANNYLAPDAKAPSVQVLHS